MCGRTLRIQMLSVIFSLPLPLAFAPLHPWNISPGKKKTKQPWPPFTIDKVTHTYVSRQRQAYRREQVLYTIWKWLVKMFFSSNVWMTLFENLTTILDRLWSYARDMTDTEWYWRVFTIPCNVLNYFQCFQKHLVDCLNVWRLFKL